jgi:hypothetical protein
MENNIFNSAVGKKVPVARGIGNCKRKPGEGKELIKNGAQLF